MRKPAGKESNRAINSLTNEQLDDFISKEVIESLFKRPLLFLATRIRDCIKQLNVYGDISRGFDILPNIIKDAKEDIEFSRYPRNSFKKSMRRLYCKLDKEKKFTIKNIIDYVGKSQRTVNIYEEQSLEILNNNCLLLVSLELENDKFTKDDIFRYKFLELLLMMKSCEALGYWTAKLEMMKQNKANVTSRTTKKEKHKEELKEWMKTMSKKECRLKAQKEFDVTDRAVLNYLKEIKDEETAFLRKKDDTA